MHLVITISQFSLIQVQKINNKEIQLPLNIKHIFFLPEALFFCELAKEELSKAQSSFKSTESMGAGKSSGQKHPHQFPVNSGGVTWGRTEGCCISQPASSIDQHIPEQREQHCQVIQPPKRELFQRVGGGDAEN